MFHLFSILSPMQNSLRVDSNWLPFPLNHLLDTTLHKYLDSLCTSLNAAKTKRKYKWDRSLWNILHAQVNMGGPETAVNWLKTVALRSPNIFRIRISGYDIDTDILRTDWRLSLPATVYGPLTNTVYAPF